MNEVEIPMRIRRHEDGCAAALTGAECACPPDEEWVPASQLRGAVETLEALARGRVLHEHGYDFGVPVAVRDFAQRTLDRLGGQ